MPDNAPTKFRVTIHGTLEQVWNEITRSDEPIAAFFDSRMDVAALKPGSKLAMRTRDGKYTGVVGEIVEYEPMRRFSHTFRFTNFDDPECVVVYDLEEVDDGVAFTLTIEDLPAGTKTAKQMVQGGAMIVKTLKATIETGRPTLGIRMLYGMFRLMAPFTPKKCRSENWPVHDDAA